MSEYEMFLLGGSVVLLIGITVFFTRLVEGGRILGAVLLLFGGGYMLYLASERNAEGLNPYDIPGALYKLIGMVMN